MVIILIAVAVFLGLMLFHHRSALGLVILVAIGLCVAIVAINVITPDPNMQTFVVLGLLALIWLLQQRRASR